MADTIKLDNGARDDNPLGAPAIISYCLLAIFSGIALGVFAIIFADLKVEPVMLGVLGSIVTCAAAAIGTVGGFWLASSIGASKNSAAMRQLAGAGAPPPADPSAPGPAIPSPASTDPAPEDPDAPSNLAGNDSPNDPGSLGETGPQPGAVRP